MTEHIDSYPLTWPKGFPRSARRIGGKFSTSLAGALANVEKSLQLFGSDSGKKVEGMVISSNVTLGAQRPADPGVAIWFTWDGLQVCIPVDRYEKVEANLQAIHHIVEARRTELRHGGLAIVRATFTGFRSLPAPGKASSQGWRAVLGFPPNLTPTRTDVETIYRKMRAANHPDKGGSAEKFHAVQLAFESAQQEIG